MGGKVNNLFSLLKKVKQGDISMKMVKKILFGLAIAAAAFTLAGCLPTEDPDGALKSENIEFTQDSSKGQFYRSFKSTATKHYSANAEIKIDNPKAPEALSTNNAVATFGFVFGLEEHKHDPEVKTTNAEGKEEKVKFYDFGIAAVRYNRKSSKIEWYVSWCEDAPDTLFGYNDASEFETKIDGVKYGKETQIIPTSGFFKQVSSLSLTDDDKLDVVIKTVANEDGSYKVSLCNADGDEKDSTTISKAVTGFEGKTQKYIGRYLTVYSGETVKGSIKYTDVNGNLIPAEYVD